MGTEISRTRFVNEYQWGDFRGNPSALMDLCYDAHLYFANWGTRILMLRLPLSWLDLDTAAEYCNDETLSARRSGKNIVLEFQSQDESGDDWEYETPGSLGLFVGLRNELSAGDLRPLYLAWLAVEPPVPAGLAQLTAPQRALADFLRVDQDLLKVAAEASGPIVDRHAADQDAVRRSVSALLAAAASQAATREAERQRELERQREMRDLEAQRHRESRLALRRGRSAQFAERLAELRSAHQRKPSLIERLDAADLP